MAKHLTFDPDVDDDDLLGDGWAGSVRRCWEQMKERSPDLCGLPHAYTVWQWAQCTLAGLPGRVVASPQCVAIATGDSVPLDRLEELLNLSDVVIHEICDPPIGGKPFYECKATAAFREQWALDHIKIHSLYSFVMPSAHGRLMTKSKTLKAAVGRARASVERRFKTYCQKAI